MLPALATIDQLEARLGTTLPANSVERVRAQAALEDVSALVRDVAGRTWVTLINSVETVSGVPDAVVVVTLAAARRAFENPTGITQKTAADVSLSFAGRADSAVYLTDSEVRTIRRAVGQGDIHPVPTTRGDTVNEMWVSVSGGGSVPFIEPS